MAQAKWRLIAAVVTCFLMVSGVAFAQDCPTVGLPDSWQEVIASLTGVIVALVGVAQVLPADNPIVHWILKNFGDPRGRVTKAKDEVSASKKSSFMIVFCVLLAIPMLYGCELIRGAKWPDTVECRQEIPDALGDAVAEVLRSGDYMKELRKLAREYGMDAVVCAVNTFVSSAAINSGSIEGEIPVDLANGKAFLDEAGTEVH